MMNTWMVLMLLFRLLLPETNVEILEFDIDRGKKVIGELIAKKESRGDKIIYTSHTEASISLIKRITVLYEFKVVFKEGYLHHADTKIYVNKKLHASSKTRLQGGQYHFVKNKKKGYLEKHVDFPVEYPAILLLFNEPDRFDASFSEEDGLFHPIERIDDHVYQKTNPKGKINEYYYQDGQLNKATMDAGIFQFLVLRKQ